jgi:Acetoacetate decarboxylase (ADC)
MQQPSIIAPPPWALTGNGYIFLYRLPQQFIQENGFLAPYQAEAYRGLVGAVMFVDYATTPVGPYHELLFIPGLFKLGGQHTFSISKIYVSSYESVWNGIENWGIPKELANFNVQKIDDRTDKLVAAHNNKPFFEVILKKSKWSFPLTTSLFPLRITQQHHQSLLLTKPSARGKARWATLLDVQIDAAHFPNFAPFKPVAVLAVEDFQMGFPVPEQLGK